jgi:hypothetical protein
MDRFNTKRFEWLKRHLTEKPDSYSLFELGCYNCPTLRYIPKPKRYVGADAGWQGGIEDARMTFTQTPWIDLVMSHSAHDLERYKGMNFDYAVALNTLEYIPDQVLRGYLQFLSQAVQKRFFVTVPVEVGIVFLGRHFKQWLSGVEGEPYTWAEIYWAARGRVEKVNRFERKGFDYRNLVSLMSEYFTIISVEGLPLRGYPMLSREVAIIAEPKRKK